MNLTFPENLTDEERAEFTAVNFLAHNVLRNQSTDKQPCWLCMSDEAKQSAREQAVAWFNGAQQPIIPFDARNEHSMAQFEKVIEGSIGHLIQQWVTAEAEYKTLRAENPRAYFCPN